eukprot:g15682.t1
MDSGRVHYSALSDGTELPVGPFSVARLARKATGMLAAALAMAATLKAGKLLQIATQVDRKPFVPEAINDVLVKPGPPTPLTFLSPSVLRDHVSCVFLYDRAAVEGTDEPLNTAMIQLGTHSEPAWVYGATVTTEQKAVVTGKESDIVKGKLFCGSKEKQDELIKKMDHRSGYDKDLVRTSNAVQRGFVGAVKQNGKIARAVWYYIAGNQPDKEPMKLAFNHMFDQSLDMVQQGEEWNKDNAFLRGNFAPVGDEHDPTPMTILEGHIPHGFDGLFLRIGPNPIPQHKYTKRYHWFDGHGMVHSVRIQAGMAGQPVRALYSNRWIETPVFLREIQEDKNYFTRIGELNGAVGLVKALFMLNQKAKYVGISALTSVVNTALLAWEGRIFALHEGGIPYELDVDDNGAITCMGFQSFGFLNFPFTAHPKVCPTSGDLFFMGYKVGGLPNYKWGHLKSGFADNQSPAHYDGLVFPGKQSIGVAFSHDMLITANHVIIPDMSVRFDPKGVVTGKGFFSMVNSSMARLAVIKRRSGEVKWFELNEPLAFVHVFNAWEHSLNEIRIWAPVTRQFDGSLKPADNSGDNQFHMAEFRLDLSKGTMRILDFTGQAANLNVEFCSAANLNVEFCSVHPSFVGLHANYGFCGLMADKGVGTFKGVVKFRTTRAGEKGEHSVVGVLLYGKNRFGGQPVFAPRLDSFEHGGDSDGSDAGYLVDFIYDEDTKSTEFVVYDAQKFTRVPEVRLKVPYRVPYGFHGAWITRPELNEHLQRAQKLTRQKLNVSLGFKLTVTATINTAEV